MYELTSGQECHGKPISLVAALALMPTPVAWLVSMCHVAGIWSLQLHRLRSAFAPNSNVRLWSAVRWRMFEGSTKSCHHAIGHRPVSKQIGLATHDF